MAEGIRAPNLPLGNSLSDFLGLETVGTTKSVKRFTRASVIGALETSVAGFQAGGGIVFSTRAIANSKLSYSADQMAWVIQDPTPTFNGIYQKQGATSIGNWQRVGDLPYSFYRAENVGAGTADAIVATNDYPLASANALIILPIAATTTSSSVTVAFNGGAPLRIKTSGGNDPAPGGLAAGMIVGGFVDGDEFRLLSDQASAAIQAAAEAAQAAAEAARDIATGAMSTFFENLFTTKAVAEAYTPTAAPDSITTQGLAVVGDGGHGLYKKNGTATGDLVITLDDGPTDVGYTLQRNDAYRPQQAAVIGYVDDRTAFQEMFDRLQDGDKLEFPGWAKAKIVNGVGIGADAWAQRADAVANGGLRAITCDKDDITVIIDGQVTATSPLDDLFRFTGKRVQVTGTGLIEYTGLTFIDTNRQDDPVWQWLPSLVYLSGEDSGVEGYKKLRFRRPPSVGVRLGGDRGFAVNAKYFGGPTTYQPNGNDNGDYRDNGTVLFHIYSGLPSTSPKKQRAQGNSFFVDVDGGRAYTNIFNTSQDGMLDHNDHDGAWEHALYSYGIRTAIANEMISNILGGAIQCFNEGHTVKNSEIEFCGGGVQFMRCTDIQAIGLKMTRIKNSGIALRSFPGEANDTLYSNILISDCTVDLDPVDGASGIDAYFDNPFDRLKIDSCIVTGGSNSGQNASILVATSPSSASKGLRANISKNTTKNSNGTAIWLDQIKRFSVKHNESVYANVSSSTCAIFGTNCEDGDVESNTAEDGRGTKKTSEVVEFSASAGNSAIRGKNNDLIGGLSSANRPAILPTDSNSGGSGNTFDGLPSEGEFTTVANQSFSVGGSGATVANSVAAAVRAGAKVRIFPVSDSAWTLQNGAGALYMSGVSNGYFTVTTKDGSTAPSGVVMGFRIVM